MTEVTSTPWWATLLTALAGSLVGGVFALAGVAWSQWATRKREFALDQLRHAREQADQLREIQRKLFVDMAEYVEDRQVWYANFQYPSDRVADLATFSLHPNQLTGRVKLYTSPVVQEIWVRFLAADDVIRWNIDAGNYTQDEFGHGELDDTRCVPQAQAAASLMTAAIRATLSTNQPRLAGLDGEFGAEAEQILAEIKTLPVRPHHAPNLDIVNEIYGEVLTRLRAGRSSGDSLNSSAKL